MSEYTKGKIEIFTRGDKLPKVRELKMPGDEPNRFEAIIKTKDGYQLFRIDFGYGLGEKENVAIAEHLINCWNCHDTLQADIDRMAGQIEEQRKELERHRWIPVSERLPEPDKNGLSLCVLVFDDGNPVNWGKATYVNYSNKNDGWWASDANIGEPTHWKPIILPEQALKDKGE